MLIEKKDNYTVITAQDDCDQQFYINVKNKIKGFPNEHIIVDFSKLDLVILDDILQFFDIAKDKRANQTSFIIVSSGIPIDEIPDELNVTPTLNEAHDILEMDAIERDLMGS